MSDMRTVPFDGEPRGSAHALAFLETDAQGEVRYATGSAWAKDGDVTSLAAWRSYLETFARTMR